MNRRRGDGGQAAVELALVLPLVAMLGLGLIQVGLVVRDQVLVTHAAREAARAAAVDPDPAAPRAAALGATGLRPSRMAVEIKAQGLPRTGQLITVRVRYRSPTEVPLIGSLVRDATLSATASMRFEG
jgi:hypothetical protein